MIPDDIREEVIEMGKTMAEHDVYFSVPERPLAKADIVFIVDEDGERLGTLKVSILVQSQNRFIQPTGNNKRRDYHDIPNPACPAIPNHALYAVLHRQ